MIRPGNTILWLFSRLYGPAVTVRNRLYDAGILRSHSFDIPVICVGNITAGGTGKTPHVLYIAEKLSSVTEVAVLSRGYLRTSKGFRAVSDTDTAADAGDEPLLMAESLNKARVYVDRDRVNGIREIMKISPSVKTVVLDDGFQHRSVKAGLNIVLTDYNRLMTRDRLLPLGMLRESLKGMKRADIIIVTKVPPGITSDEMNSVKNELCSAGAPERIFFTSLEYGEPVPLFNGHPPCSINAGTEVLLVTGIANPAPLAAYLSSVSAGVKHLSFSDHHKFTVRDLDKITAEFDALKGNNKIIITTAKDGVRLKEITNIAIHVMEAICYLPVKVHFIENEEEFVNNINLYAGKDH